MEREFEERKKFLSYLAETQDIPKPQMIKKSNDQDNISSDEEAGDCTPITPITPRTPRNGFPLYVKVYSIYCNLYFNINYIILL